MTAPVKLLQDDPYLACRHGARGHLWDELPLARRTSFGQPQDDRCVGCGGTRHRIIDALGQVAAQWYEMPPDYRLDFPYTTDDVRLEWLRRRRQLAKARSKSALTFTGSGGALRRAQAATSNVRPIRGAAR